MRPYVTISYHDPVFGEQVAILDERDAHRAKGHELLVDNGVFRWLVPNPRTNGRTQLARLIAAAHVKQPSPEHKYIGYRNGSPCDMRAANLYWRTSTEAMGHKRVAARIAAARAVPSRHSPERGALG